MTVLGTKKFRVVVSLLTVLFVNTALAESKKSIIDDPGILSRDCFQDSFASYDSWRERVVSKRSNNTPEKIAAARTNFEKRIPREVYERYKKSLSCLWITYPVDGGMVSGYIIKPKHTPKKLPVIIYNRGGNLDYGGVFFGRLFGRLFPYAMEGFVVIGTQYRGTFDKKRKPEFTDQFGGDDVNDVLALLKLLSNIRGADSSRVAMVGHSRGAMQTLLTLRQKAKVDVAAVLAGPYDLLARHEENWRPEMEEVYKARIPNYEKDKKKQLIKRSAVYWANELDRSIPILIAHGQNDKRTNPVDSIKLALELQKIGHPYKLVIYPQDDHSFSLHREEVDKLVINWIRKNLDAKNTPVESVKSSKSN